MSLTAKWNAEHLERIRRGWLEKTLVCMRTARHYEDVPDSTYTATLNSFLAFLNTNKGIIAEWDADQEEWVLKGSKNADEASAKEFFKKNSPQLLKNNAIQNNVDGVYVIPLKNNYCSVIVGLYDAQTQSDPEWYKLLNMLLITSVEGLENASIKAKNYCETNKNCKFMATAKKLRSDLKKLQEKYESDEDVKSLFEKIDKVIKASKAQ